MNDILTAASTSSAPKLDFTSPQRFLRIGDDDIAYYRTGSGPDLVFVHGWPLHAATWRGLLPALAQHFTCHLFDLPGCGLTRSDGDGPLSIAKHRDTLLGLVESLAIERCAMIGHDSGAAIARLAADALGDRVWALVMGNTEIPGHHPWLVTVFGLMARVGGQAAFERFLGSRAFRRSYFCYGSCFHDRSLIEGAFHDLFVAPLLADERALRGQLRLLHGFDWAALDDLEAVHRRIKAPVQLLWGAGDPYFPLEKARRMRFGGPSELEVLDNAKLFAHEEATDEFVAHALRFLRHHAPR